MATGAYLRKSKREVETPPRYEPSLHSGPMWTTLTDPGRFTPGLGVGLLMALLAPGLAEWFTDSSNLSPSILSLLEK